MMPRAEQRANNAELNPPRGVARREKSNLSPAWLQPVPRPEDDKAKAGHGEGRREPGLRPSRVPLSSNPSAYGPATQSARRECAPDHHEEHSSGKRR